MAVAIGSALVKRRKRALTKSPQGKPDDRACACAICRGVRRWPRYYVGLWIFLPLRSSPPADWIVRWVSYECVIQGLEPDLDTPQSLPPTTERQAMDEGLSVRDRDRRSIYAPPMQGDCEACGDLRVRRRRFCLGCESKVRKACREVGWAEDLIARYLAAPVNGHDEFAEGTIEIIPA